MSEFLSDAQETSEPQLPDPILVSEWCKHDMGWKFSVDVSAINRIVEFHKTRAELAEAELKSLRESNAEYQRRLEHLLLIHADIDICGDAIKGKTSKAIIVAKLMQSDSARGSQS